MKDILNRFILFYNFNCEYSESNDHNISLKDLIEKENR